jgi:hypothetical protein
MTGDDHLRCVVCDAPFYPNRYWQRYCGPSCCATFHSRERKAMRQWWRQQHAQQTEFVERLVRIHAEIETAQVEPIRRRL